MKLRSYLRGIGLGILVASALFICSGKAGKSTMTDEQVIARAKALGMVDNQYLSDYTYPTQESISESSREEFSREESKTQTEDVSEASGEETTTTEPSSSAEELQAEEMPPKDEINPSQKFYVIVVNKGDGSDTVSRKVFETGLVPDASEFDHYLMEHGYDRKITTGNHEIPSDATVEQMAEILCSN